MNSPSLSPGRQAYLLAVRRQKRQVRLWQAAMYFLIRLHRADRMHQIGQKF